ncbi:permease [soil metagenome]
MFKITSEKNSSALPFFLSSALAAAAAFFPWGKFLTFRLPDHLQDGLTIFFGILIEALPFVVLGVTVSILIQRFVTADRLQRFLPKSPLLAFPVVSLLGMVFPVCECGNQPVARQLMRQGMRPSHAITFLLGAPILNPIVMISTFVAFRYSPALVAARFILGFLVAVLVGIYFYYRGDSDITTAEIEDPEHCHPDHNHGGVNHFVTELTEMLGALAVGAIIAAVVQIYIPRSMLLGLGSSPMAAIAVMMGLALIVSLCSTVDAFFALSFSSTFSSSSLLAFLVFGPMIDFRALSLLSRSFKPRAIVTMTVLVAELVFVSTLLLHHWGIV